ncbi:heptahelical transmembrane protein 1-like [Hibiscus syriacus]|uniref:heptahelical transmembrane protein 1-like n=1 Tax=Hibiscus syriacus TaxID=106335 RepID=UPI0019218351|nr:heptahelical transmembrane protein 1-like [Hibiscus syriacus]
MGLTMTHLIEVPQVSDLIAFFTSYFPMSGDLNVSHDPQDLFMRTTSNNLIDLKPESESDVTRVTRWPFYVFLAGSMFCLLSSTICHLFSCHSHHLNLSLLRLDYAGITAMIITSFFPPIYYIFQCDPQWHFVYLGGITVLGLFTIATLLSPALSTKKFRGFRALLFSSMALFGIIPGIHAAVVNWSNPRSNVTLAYELAMAMFYLTGTLFYISRIPERFKPGWFDLAGHSHQIFHILVVMGALAHYGASLVFPDWLDRHSC